MKLMFASDLHGSRYYTEEMLKCFQYEAPDTLILLGDLLYHGPRNDLPRAYDPKGVIELLNAIREKLLCIRGNCDADVDQMVLKFPILASYAAIYAEGHRFYLTHGDAYHCDNLPPLMKGDTLIYGHTHIPLACWKDSIACINPGSVSLPKQDSPHSYVIYENHRFTFKDLSQQIYQTFSLPEQD